MSLHGGLHIRQGRLLLAAMVVMAMGLPMSAAPSVAAPGSPTDKVWVCKVVGPANHYRLQTGNNPIHVAINSTQYNAAFADSHPSFVLQPGDYSGAEPGFGDCEAKWNPRPGISVVKTATLNDVAGNTAGKADAGETIMYSFLVTNTGSVTLSGVAVTDSKLASPIVCDPTELAPTAHVTCTAAAYLVTASDVEAGAPILNTATATGMGPDGSTATATDTASTPTQKLSVDSVVPVVPTVPTVQPKITLKAAVVNDAGGTAQVSDFTLTGSSIQVASGAAVQNGAAMVASAATTSFSGVTGDAAITNAAVPVGTYSLSESALPLGYSASAWACTGGQLNGSALTVTFGNAVECVITNTYSSTVVDSPGVPTADPASPPPAVVVVDKAAPRAKAPTAKAPAAATPAAATPAVTTLAFTGAEPVPLSLLALLALVLGVALTVAGRRQGGHWARE